MRSLVGCAVAVVPQHKANTLRLGITAELGYTLTSSLLIPQCVNQYILVAHCCREVHHLLLVVVVGRIVLPYKPTPYIASWLVLLRSLVQRLYNVVAYGGLHYRLER